MEKLSSALVTKMQNFPLKTSLKHDLKDINTNTTLQINVPIIDNLPENFNGPIIWKHFLSKIKNQGTCGSCWAWATSTTLADRFALMSLNKLKPNLSPLRMLLCDLAGKEWSAKTPESYMYTSKLKKLFTQNIGKLGCHGNSIIDAWRYLYVLGTNEDNCLSYENKNSDGYNIVDYENDDELPICTDLTSPEGDLCGDFNKFLDKGTPARFFRAICYYGVNGTPKNNGSDLNIMSEIYMNGPVTAGIETYPSFYQFDPKKEIYKSKKDEPRVGGHAVRIVGWGVEKDVKFWWIANSWGEKWGINGYFKMIRGVNDCKLEENIITGIPDFFTPNEMILPKRIQYIIDKMSEKDRTDRLTIDYGNGINGGGIDPRTGYTRRVQWEYTGFNFSSPISLGDVIKIYNKPFNTADPYIMSVYNKNFNENIMKPINMFIIGFSLISFALLMYICFKSVKS